MLLITALAYWSMSRHLIGPIHCRGSSLKDYLIPLTTFSDYLALFHLLQCSNTVFTCGYLKCLLVALSLRDCFRRLLIHESRSGLMFAESYWLFLCLTLLPLSIWFLNLRHSVILRLIFKLSSCDCLWPEMWSILSSVTIRVIITTWVVLLSSVITVWSNLSITLWIFFNELLLYLELSLWIWGFCLIYWR